MNPQEMQKILNTTEKVVVEGACFGQTKNLIVMILDTNDDYPAYAFVPEVAKKIANVFQATIASYEQQYGTIAEENGLMLSPFRVSPRENGGESVL